MPGALLKSYEPTACQRIAASGPVQCVSWNENGVSHGQRFHAIPHYLYTLISFPLDNSRVNSWCGAHYPSTHDRVFPKNEDTPVEPQHNNHSQETNIE